MADFDQVFDLKQESNHLDPFDLEDLLAGITGSNLHHAVETGIPMGNETW
jgi:hypothetical protein